MSDTPTPDLTTPEHVERLIVWLMDAHEMGDTSKNPEVWRTLEALSAALEAEQLANGHEKRLRLDVIAMEQAATARAEAAEAERDAGLIREKDANAKAMQHLRRAEKAEIASKNHAAFSHEWREMAEAAEAERDALKETLTYCENQWAETDRETQTKMLAEHNRAEAAEAQLAQRDAALKAADELAKSAKKQKDRFLSYVRKPDAKKAMRSLDADDDFDAALGDYLKARGQDAD